MRVLILSNGSIYIIYVIIFTHGSRIHLLSMSLHIYCSMVNLFCDVHMIARWLLGILCLSGLVATMQAGKINVHKNYIRPRGNLKPLIVPLLLHKQQYRSWWSFSGISWKHKDGHNFSFACAQFFFNSMKEIIISQFYFCMFCLSLNIKTSWYC
jgi:hypothetical protein